MKLLEYRVVEMEDDSFQIQMKTDDDPTWRRPPNVYDFVTAAGACTTFKKKVREQQELMKSRTVRGIIMAEDDI